jgi:hypothetical protein
VRLQARAQVPNCGNPRFALPLLRAFNGAVEDHFYTTDTTEMNTAVTRLGYVGEGVTGYVFSNQQPSTVPFYRLYNGPKTDHFYTKSAEERDNAIATLGYVSEGIVGFIYPDATACGGLPLYRSFKGGASSDHFFTMSAAERDSAQGAGYVFKSIPGYMLAF